MRINNNIMAMNTHRQYTINVSNVSKSTERLSSGYRVNRAGDDAAGLAISEKMRTQIRGLNMASKNSQDAISLVQTAEGALQESHNILQRMRELAAQSASDTNETSIDRAALNAEFQQLIAEIDDTAKKTRFNDMGVIDGTYGQTGGIKNATGPYGIGSTILVLGDDLEVGRSVLTGAVSISGGNWQLTLTYDSGPNRVEQVSISADHLKVGSHTVTFADGTKYTYQLSDTINTDNNVITPAASDEIDLLVSAAGTSAVANASTNYLTIQTGANQGDELILNINGLTATGLGLTNAEGTSNYSVATREDASNALSIVMSSINIVSAERAKLGAMQNRLNHKIQNIETSSENLAAAESRIRDLDMAKEMTEYTKNNILVQASTSMLAQANMASQSVLSLIGG